MTIVVWSLALLGSLGKLFPPALNDAATVALYLALGWVVLFAIKPHDAAGDVDPAGCGWRRLFGRCAPLHGETA